MPPSKKSAAPAADAAADPERMELNFAVKQGLLRSIATFIVSFVMVHYLFFGGVGALLLWLVARTGMVGMIISAVAVMVYLPSYLAPVHVSAARRCSERVLRAALAGVTFTSCLSLPTRSQKRTGRTWNAFRDLGFWTLVQEYLQLRIVRSSVRAMLSGAIVIEVSLPVLLCRFGRASSTRSGSTSSASTLTPFFSSVACRATVERSRSCSLAWSFAYWARRPCFTSLECARSRCGWALSMPTAAPQTAR
jgi:hypothetical protein